jgi:hypothetical protein
MTMEQMEQPYSNAFRNAKRFGCQWCPFPSRFISEGEGPGSSGVYSTFEQLMQRVVVFDTLGLITQQANKSRIWLIFFMERLAGFEDGFDGWETELGARPSILPRCQSVLPG